jgi:signal transduction histidine kinase
VDQGCGISPENLERIFDPYFTTKQFGDEVLGFGLGLTICEKIVDLHQGKIAVRSEVDRGTRAIVELPTAPSAFAPIQEKAVPA